MKTIENLNNLLATSAVFYQNLRTYHWYVTGQKFFSLHNKFEELYTETSENIDELAERILMLNGKPLHNLKQYLEHSVLNETSLTKGNLNMVEEAKNGLETLLKLERDTLLATDDADEGTKALLSDLIVAHEKHIWMLKAFLAE